MPTKCRYQRIPDRTRSLIGLLLPKIECYHSLAQFLVIDLFRGCFQIPEFANAEKFASSLAHGVAFISEGSKLLDFSHFVQGRINCHTHRRFMVYGRTHRPSRPMKGTA